MTEAYPPIKRNFSGVDRNPAIQLFGRRFFGDQTIMEFLVELLLVSLFPKRIDGEKFPGVFPDREILIDWPARHELEYAAPAKLGLKLFSFLGASKLETRHDSHKDQYKTILNLLANAIETESDSDKEDILKTLENLFLGFQGVGQNRTWCTQTFTPVSIGLLASESIWQQTEANKVSLNTWSEALGYFSHSQYIFLARGGELLYLQICNALRQPIENIDSLRSDLKIHLNEEESDPERLYGALTDEIPRVTQQCPEALNDLALLIDGIDEFSSSYMGIDTQDSHFTECAWCPAESWREGYLFAVELLRICQAKLDPIEKIEMLSLCCAFQVLRSLCAQSARVIGWPEDRLESGNGLGFVWAASSPSGDNRTAKHISQRNLLAIRELIYSAIRIPEIQSKIKKEEMARRYREADTRYGDRLFLSLSKKLGFVVPQRGPGARFVISDRIMRYLILALIRPGKRYTLDYFRGLLFAHYGLAIDAEGMNRACIWSGYPPLSGMDTGIDEWLIQMLEAAGFLVHLSDACSLVQNPFG